MPHQYAPGFASAKKKGVIKPFDERVKICASRLKAAIKKEGGTINVSNRGDLLNFCLKAVYNRGFELGEGRDYKLVAYAAIDSGSVSVDYERGVAYIGRAPWKRSRNRPVKRNTKPCRGRRAA